MTQTDFDATALQALLQNTTQGTCYACHVGLLDKLDFDWFRRHPDFISQCTQDGLVYYNGIEVFGMGFDSHPAFVMSQEHEQELRDFLNRTIARCF